MAKPDIDELRVGCDWIWRWVAARWCSVVAGVPPRLWVAGGGRVGPEAVACLVEEEGVTEKRRTSVS
jgi:hypothetical protein